MQTTAIRTVANSLPEKGVILLTLLISDRYILFAELGNKTHNPRRTAIKIPGVIVPVYQNNRKGQH